MSHTDRSVLFLGAFPRSAVLERYVSGDLALRLKANEWRVRLASHANGRLARLLDILAHAWRHRHEYALACVDVFSGPAFVWAEVGCALLRRYRKPYVLALHGGNLPEFAAAHPARVRRLLTSAAAVTCPSPYLVAQMRAFRPDLILLPNGIDLARYAFRERVPPLREIVWLRAFHRMYNPCLAVEAVARVAAKRDLRLTMIGPDKDGSLSRVQTTATHLGVSHLVTLRPGVEKHDVPRELARGDLFLNTTNVDNTPVSILEAMACGLPVISTNVGGIPYLLDHDRDALLVPVNDAGAIAAAVERLHAEPGLAARLARQALQKVAAYDWNVVLPRWQRLLEGVIERRSLGTPLPAAEDSLRESSTAPASSPFRT